jgi:putative FmdB family regulatory protein
MPTYQYQCKKCGHELEEFQSIKEEPLTLCPQCKTNSLARVMGTGGGVIFKGSGFYLTDYKNAKSPSTSTKKETKSTPDKKD